MLQRLRLFFLLAALACWLPAAVHGEDEKKEPAPAPGEDEKDEPAPAPEEGDEEKPKPGEDEDPPGESGEEPAGQPKQPTEPAAPPPAKRAVNDAVPPVPTPAGMVYLEGGRVWIGTDAAYLNEVLAGRPPDIRKLFLYETPHHTVFLRPYFIGQFEVTNAQYQRFLEHVGVTYDTVSGSLANLDEIAAYLVNLTPDQQKNPRQKVWQQLYFANKDIIWKAFKDRLDDFLVKRPDGTIDEVRTARNFRFEPLPRTLKLQFYSLRPPDDWPDTKPPKGRESHPVRHVSYNDAEHFAEWAGMHLPTEFEWEWAARGPGSPIFPWGDHWPLDASLANWGGKVTDARFETTTLPVRSRYGANPDGSAGRDVPIDGDGRSWCGCYNMVGNVAEWTSSWFEPYRLSRMGRHNYMGWVKVIRGGGAADGEMLVLRPACRNFVGGGADAPPFPPNSFEWCGFRLASYMKSGRDQLGPVVRRATRPNKIKKHQLDLDRFIGSVTRSWVEPGAEPEHHVYILGRSSSILLIPNKSFLRPEGMQAMQKAWKRPSSYKTVKGIAKKSETQHPEWILGVLHTDIPLEPVEVRKPIPKEDEETKKSGRRRRGRAKIPELIEGRCPPGTYLLSVWFGRLALLDPFMEFVCFVPLKEKQKTNFELGRFKPDEIQPTRLAVNAVLDEAEIYFDMPLGGKSVDEKLRLTVSARLQFELGSLEAAGKWIQEDPAKDITADLWQKWLEAEKDGTNGKPVNGKGSASGNGKSGPR